MAVESPKKQTQFKPNQSQFRKGPNECKLNFNKGLQKKRWFRSPNEQTQFLQKPKMNVNLYVIEDYENEPPSGSNKTNPIQSLSWACAQGAQSNGPILERKNINFCVTGGLKLKNSRSFIGLKNLKNTVSLPFSTHFLEFSRRLWVRWHSLLLCWLLLA